MALSLESIKGILSKKVKILSGIEIEENYVKILFLDRETSTIFYKPLEISIDKDTSITDLIKSELLSLNINEKMEAVIGLPVSSTLIKNIKLPNMERKDLVEAIEWNIKEEIQTIKGETVYDFSILGEEEDTYNILVVVAKKAEVEQLEKLEKDSNLTIKCIDSNPIALLNIAQLYKEKKGSLGEEDNITCVLYIDRYISYIVHFQNTISTQLFNFHLSSYSSLEENMADLTKLVNEINYFFLTVSEPSTVYLGGEILEFPEVRSFVQSKFVGKFAFVEINPAEVLDINYTGDKHPGVYAVPFGLIYRGLSE